jgi:hypothetical protein
VFWAWFLKYSSFFITGGVSLAVGLLLSRLTSRRANLICYMSQTQWVTITPLPGQPAVNPIGTFTLFLFNQGKAPARDVHVGHFFLPANNVFPDIPRDTVATPSGGYAIRFPVIPPRVLISISYLYFGPPQNVISYVGSEEGSAKQIPVVLQQVHPRWRIAIITILLLAGIWVAVNATVSLVRFLFHTFYS